MHRISVGYCHAANYSLLIFCRRRRRLAIPLRLAPRNFSCCQDKGAIDCLGEGAAAQAYLGQDLASGHLSAVLSQEGAHRRETDNVAVQRKYCRIIAAVRGTLASRILFLLLRASIQNLCNGGRSGIKNTPPLCHPSWSDVALVHPAGC